LDIEAKKDYAKKQEELRKLLEFLDKKDKDEKIEEVKKRLKTILEEDEIFPNRSDIDPTKPPSFLKPN